MGFHLAAEKHSAASPPTHLQTCGFCSGTLLIAYHSKYMTGPWLRQIISGDTRRGQFTGVLSLPSPSGGATSYLHIADLVCTAPLSRTRTAAHGHRFQVLSSNFNSTVNDLNCSPTQSFTVSHIPGTNVSSSSLATIATDSSGGAATYTPICNLPTYQLYQTFTISKSGTLSGVGVNIVSDNLTGNFTITIFRHQINGNFFTPHYVWETLTTINTVPSTISQAFEAVCVSVGKAVAAGDKLGIALVSASTPPMCTLVQTSANVLFDVGTTVVRGRCSRMVLGK